MAEGTRRAESEVLHGRRLAMRDPEAWWGWNTPAGRCRAERRARLIAAGAGLKPGVRALEIGCGTGLFTAFFAETGASVCAIDISEELLQRARARSLPSDRVQFVRGRFEEAVLGEAFDAIVGSSVLHHLELEPALARIRGLLRPGGWMSFAEPNLLNPQVWAERTFRRWFPYVSPDETAFVAGRLRKRLAAAGLEEAQIVPFDWLHPGTPPRLILFVQALGRRLEGVPILRAFAGSLWIRARRPDRG